MEFTRLQHPKAVKFAATTTTALKFSTFYPERSRTRADCCMLTETFVGWRSSKLRPELPLNPTEEHSELVKTI